MDVKAFIVKLKAMHMTIPWKHELLLHMSVSLEQQ
jgi:hypothetical protein